MGTILGEIVPISTDYTDYADYGQDPGSPVLLHDGLLC
jgi:hypothetical protein